MVDYDIRLYQRLTKILERLTTQAEADVEARLQFLNKRFQETSESVETMGLQLDHFRSTLRSFDDTLTGRLSRSVQVVVFLRMVAMYANYLVGVDRRSRARIEER